MTRDLTQEKNVKQDKRLVKQITTKSSDFSRWYVEIVRKAALVDYAPVKGMMVIRPYGYAIWENLQGLLDRRIKETGHSNAYFPLFIPESFLQKETEHLEGFTPQVAWVTHGGGEKLSERLAVRPTSEAIIGNMYAKWIKSYRDLPVLINQWANIIRWEKVTRPFLRTTEFLWQEGHTAHESEEEAQKETMLMLSLYKDFVESELAIPVISGKKTAREKFAGASATYCIEALMSDGKALQMGTSHFLGQHFSKVFDIKFEDRNQKLQYVWQTSWGVSTRLIGGLVMTHGDDSGLRIPPKIAPVQIVIVPIPVANWKETVLPMAKRIEGQLKGARIRAKLDDREEFTPGWKFSDWEMRGVPLRLEVGPKDIENNQVLSVRRDTGAKSPIKLHSLLDEVRAHLNNIQQNMLEQAREFQLTHTYELHNYEKFKSLIEEKKGFIKAFWCGDQTCEDKVKEETMATIRVILLEKGEGKTRTNCLCCGKEADNLVLFARAY